MSTTAFLDYSNERHPFYADSLENTACAWEQLGAVAEARTLRRALELRADPAIGRHDAKAHAPPLEPKAGHRDEPSDPRPIGQAPTCPPPLLLAAVR